MRGAVPQLQMGKIGMSPLAVQVHSRDEATLLWHDDGHHLDECGAWMTSGMEWVAPGVRRH